MPTFWFVLCCILYNSYCCLLCWVNSLEKHSVKSMFGYVRARASGLYNRKYRYKVAGAVSHLKHKRYKNMTRIELKNTMFEAVANMSGGNPGALTVCMDILDQGSQIDPDSAMGGFGALLSLDTHEIYEHRIWMFYKDVCGENLSKMLAVLRSCQLGFVNNGDLNNAIDNYGHGIDIDDLIEQVRERLPEFNIEE